MDPAGNEIPVVAMETAPTVRLTMDIGSDDGTMGMDMIGAVNCVEMAGAAANAHAISVLLQVMKPRKRKKQMPKKQRQTKEQRRQIRLQKGKQWLLTYTGSPKHMNKHYRERFHVDSVTAAKDLQSLGVNYTQEQLDRLRSAEEYRIQQLHKKKKESEFQKTSDFYDDCDDRFAYIVGYTSGGAAYGLQWEDVGIDPDLPFEEKVRLYQSETY